MRLRGPRRPEGREQRGTRYGVVVQSADLLALSTVVAAPTSTQAQPASFRPEITIRGARTRVLADQVTAIDNTRIGAVEQHLDWQALAALDRALQLVLGLR